MGEMKSPEMQVMEWLYEHKYGKIHLEWFRQLGVRSPFDYPIIPWLKEKYPEIWKEHENK